MWKIFDQPVAAYQYAGYSLTEPQTEMKMARLRRIYGGVKQIMKEVIARRMRLGRYG